MADVTGVTLPLVSLPRLAHLDLDTEGFDPTGRLLEYMCIPSSCTVSILVIRIRRDEIDKKATFGPIIRALSTHAKLYFAPHIPRHLELLFTRGKFHFTLGTTAHSDEPRFSFNLNLGLFQYFPTHTLTMLLNEFALPCLSKVTSCRIGIGNVNNPIPTFTDVMACLSSVTTITTDKQSLRHLRAYSVRKGETLVPRTVFPALNILEITHVPYYDIPCKFDNPPDAVSKYVKARIAHGHAISVIELQRSPWKRPRAWRH